MFADMEGLNVQGATHLVLPLREVGLGRRAGPSPDAHACWNECPSRPPQQCEDKWGHLCALADFSLALTESIQEINKHSFNNFELRIGE